METPKLTLSSAPEVRLRTRIPPEELEAKVGKILAPSDCNLLVINDVNVRKPDGSLLLVYRKGIVPQELRDATYPVLTTIRLKTDNRGLASGSKRIPRPSNPRQSYSAPVMSSLLGSMEAMGGRFPYCRLTAWTGQHMQEYEGLFPLFQFAGERFRDLVPDRYANQMGEVAKTEASWVIPGTPFTTITVNNTYPTGVHTDKGDLDAGFSCLLTLRRGNYRGGWLTFPEFRVGVDMQDGDMILMDAHEWHGNVKMELDSEDAERISVVCYYRTDIKGCKTPMEEVERANSRDGMRLLYGNGQDAEVSDRFAEEVAAGAGELTAGRGE